MARPYSDKLERELSPLSPLSGGSQTPISYSANVNRQKTKKWVEAKPADYGGDDWGDDYDDYSAPPPLLPKTTGLRQPGQVSQTPSSGGFPGDEMNKKAYGDLPSLPAEAQTRSVTNPVRERANSFTRDDERRTFSGGYAQPPLAPKPAPSRIGSQGEPDLAPSTTQSNHPPVLQVSTQVPVVMGLRKAVQPSSPAASQPPQGAVRETPIDEPQSGASSKYSEATSKYSEIRTPSSDFQTRRDFSPSAVPPPLQTRQSPGPQSAATDSPSSRFPPRKSSISQPVPPEVFQQPQSTQEVNTPKPWIGARSSSPGAAARSPTTPGKGLPFIRPADIYRRMEEEREKERQSMDSSRPSMESIVGGNAAEQSSSPAKPAVLGQPPSDNLSGSLNRGAIQESEDRVDSSQHLTPMLEPIQERKSEYGFEGYDPTRFIGSPEEKTGVATSKESQAGRLNPEEMRRLSTSPKLPDLNRISGFGLDLFSQSSTDETSFQDSVLKSIPESSPSTYPNESNLRTQQSSGFASVVQQAFNAENTSVPDTPASVSSSRVERTGSESTTTAGISPIMSRLSSTAPANTLDKELEVRVCTTPSIAEVDERDQSQNSTDLMAGNPEHQATALSNKDIEESGQQPGRPLHRSNISTPSPGNSPVRAPHVAITEGFRSAVPGHISTTPDPAISPVDEDDLPQPSRPFPEREPSFRPNLPGGWVSYATTATNSTAEQEPRDNQQVETYSRHTDPMMDAPVSPISESEEDDNDVDLTPSTAKRALPESAFGAAAGAALGGVAAATFERRDKGMLSSASSNETSVQGLHMIPGNSALPTPDPVLAPIGNPYGASALDPRLQEEPSADKSALAIPVTPGNGTFSITSTEPPTPPPKDTPADEPIHGNPEYFPPTVPLKHKTLDEVAATEGLVLPMRPEILPTLSTQTSPQDEESDKLRKEIIKSLSPNVSDAEARQRLVPPEIPENYHIEDSTALGTRESTYLPSEYDNYWESTNEAEAEERERQAKIEESSLKQEPEQPQLTKKSTAEVQDTSAVTPPIPPLSPQRDERASIEIPVQRPSLPSNRFSWEAGPEEVSSSIVPANTQLQVPSSGIDPRYAATPDSQLRQLEQTREAYFEHGPISTSGNTPALENAPTGQVQEDAILTPGSNSNDQRRSGGQESSHSHAETEAAIAAAGVAGAGAVAYADHQANQQVVPQRRLSLAEEKNPVNATTYAVSPTPPEDEHSARVSQPTIPPSISGPAASRQPEGRDPSMTFRPKQTPDVTKIMQFRDILAFQNPEQRIRAYNDTRDQFAAMDTGLANWLIFLSSNQRNSFPAGSWAGPATAGNSAERSKVPKSNQSGVPGTPLQQPYYQQYLNASPTSSVPSMARPDTGITSGSQQGFSPSGSKLSGQQTKSKDLLHSAGVFGGKASKAGKGLFARGKNKLRGSGGGDKDSPPLEASPAPKPKVNEGRTSSWNLSLSSLALPRSSARASTPSQHSREATPPPQRQSQLGPVTPQNQSQLRSENPPTGTTGQTELSIWDAPISAASTPSIQHSTPQPSTNNENHISRYVGSNDLSKEEEEQDNLGVPAPIGKHQPSWDPYNATPIVEEEGFQYDDRPSKQPLAIPPAPGHLGIPQAPVDAKSDRSASGDAPFYDASEQPAEADDWVIVSKENVPKLSELSFAAPVTIPSNAVIQPNIAPQPAAAFTPPNALQPPVSYQPRLGFQPTAGSQPSAGQQPPAMYHAAGAYQPLAGYQSDTGHQPLGGHQPPAGYPPGVGYQQPAGLPGGNQPALGYQPPATSQPPISSQPPVSAQGPATSQPQTSSHGGFRGRFIQHIRQRSSKDGNMPVAGHGSTPPATAKAEQAQPAEENRTVEKRPTEFVGLPPIRRSSTFGLGFRTKDLSKRFPLDDDDEDDIQPDTTIPPVLEGGNNSQRQDSKPVVPVASQADANSRLDNGISGGEAALGATAIAAAVGDRAYQPSGEPSRYSTQYVQPTQVPVDAQQRPPLSNVSSDYSRPSSFSPVSPPVSSPVSPPGSRPAFLAGASRDSVGPSTAQQADVQPLHAVQDRRPDAECQPNATLAQEPRAVSSVSYQRSPPVEPNQNSSQIPPIAVHPRHPSFEGQRPANSPSYAREPPSEGQRLRPPSSSSQGNFGTLPILSSGVFVPPPRPGPNQQKPFDQPPSSAQRYPALFRAEHGGKEPSVDGLPAHYYQAPISKEDAFLPRQQTNEYQLPGVGPPPQQLQSAKRNSQRNSGLFKELGGRLSRSASRDRDSTVDDDARSPVRPVESRDSQSRDYSAASVTSEDTVEKKKRKSGLSFFGALRRDSAGGPMQSRESMVTHLPVSRTDSMLQPQPQPSSPLAQPDKKKLFFGSNRSSSDIEKSKPNRLLRTSTSSMTGEQTGKKKRFSGITSMFSRPSMEQERRGSSGSAAQTMQDPRNLQQTAPPGQGSQYLEYPSQQDNRRFQGQGGPPPQAFLQSRQDQYLRGPPGPGYPGQSASQPLQIEQSMQGIQRQESPGTRGVQIAPPLPSPSLLNPTLQTSLIETRPVQDRQSSQQYGPNLHNQQIYQRQTAAVMQTGPSSQSVPTSQSPQSHQRQTSGVAQSIPISQPAQIPQNLQNSAQQPMLTSQPSALPQPIRDPQSSLSRQQHIPLTTQSSSVLQPVPNSQVPSDRPQQTSITTQPSPVSQSVIASQNPQGQARQTSLGTQSVPLIQPTASQSPGQFAENRANYQQGLPTASGGQLNPQSLQASQQPQYQQRGPLDPSQANLRLIDPPQTAHRTSQETPQVLAKQSPAAHANQPKVENKQRQGSTARLLSGLIGGRRSSAQQAKDNADVQMGAPPQIAMPPRQPQQQQHQQPLQQQPQQQQWQQQQRMPPNNQVQRIPEQNQQRGRPTSQEPQYAPLPIPVAYNLVRGEGGQLAPTPYDPRGLNAQPGGYSNQQYTYRDQTQSYPSRPPQIQVQSYPNNQYITANRSSPPQITTTTPENTNRDGRPGPGPQQNSQNSNKSNRPLSSEDLVARSPARPQFGQQAPYQLSLPDENAERDERDRPLPSDKNVPSERHLPLGGKPHVDKVIPTERSLPRERALPPTASINTNPQLTNPSLRHPLSPATYPLPEHAPFSPINPKADQIPPPPPPKWPQQVAPSQNLDRSNTINTHASEVSQLSGGQLIVPGPTRHKEQERPASVTPPSPQITPERSPEQLPRHMASPPQEEDVYSASPRHSVVVGGNAPVATEAPQQSPEKILVDGRDSQNGRRRTSQEEKILVEEGMVRPGSAQEEVPSMSATSYPGQEWHPYGNGYEEWD